ncbi:site-specific DNA-methyltransferase [Anaerovibrio sp. RM50]|uniref:site-specific DNA-methyltransferase n=1 Tax=Anaerovibrio sp. RM50 TaxID=1200557 RepID=UPI00048655D9|nr:site-specific DNA-methyltransferase [Anaerovibrio sp. RM50]
MEKRGKLELTWVGKYKEEKLEPRILIENVEKSYGEQNTENMLIHGDNLLALKALELDYTGMIKCIYIDPPYNTKAAVELYDDNLEHSIWLSIMKKRLELLRNLLSDDGSIWIQIDDEEQAYLKVLCDEVFGRTNFVNMISVNMKNVAGASGGGEDKRLKKNCEYILVYAKNYALLPLFNGPYKYTEISELIQQYIDEGRSWKYTSVLVNPGEKEYIGSTVDGDGNEIKIYRRVGLETMSVNQIANRDNITSQEAYKRYGINVFRTTNAQTSIRTRIIDFRKENDISDEYLSIEYIPRTGKNRGTVYEQFYKGDVCNLFVWLKDTSEIIEGKLYKKDLQGTYWDMNAWMKNLTKEGDVTFPKGKKPEKLLKQIIEMTTSEGEYVLDSFLGSGTTAATAHKIGRKWIGIEMGEQVYSHCKQRLDNVIDGEQGGISKEVNWNGGGGYKFYELAEPLLVRNKKLPVYMINSNYTWDMVCEAICKIEGFKYSICGEIQGYSSENRFIHITEGFVNTKYVMSVMKNLGENQSLLVYCKKHQANMILPENVEVKKIPKDLLDKCSFEYESEVQE